MRMIPTPALPPRTFARVQGFDLACPNCGAIDAVKTTSVLTPRGTNALVDRRGKTTENPKVLCGRRSESKPVGFSELECCRR